MATKLGTPVRSIQTRTCVKFDRHRRTTSGVVVVWTTHGAVGDVCVIWRSSFVGIHASAKATIPWFIFSFYKSVVSLRFVSPRRPSRTASTWPRLARSFAWMFSARRASSPYTRHERRRHRLRHRLASRLRRHRRRHLFSCFPQ
jgi:hypothetical protein